MRREGPQGFQLVAALMNGHNFAEHFDLEAMALARLLDLSTDGGQFGYEAPVNVPGCRGSVRSSAAIAR